MSEKPILRVYQVSVDGTPELVTAETMREAIDKHMRWTLLENAEHDVDEEWYWDLLGQVVLIGDLKQGPWAPVADEA